MNIYGGSLENNLSNGGEIDGDLVVTGDGTFENLTVTDTATISTLITEQELKVVDPIILMGKDNPADNVNLGILEEYTDGTKKYSGLLRDRTTKQQYLLEGATPEPGTTTDLTLLPRGDLVVGGLQVSNYTMPAVGGSGGQIMVTDAAGVLTFQDIPVEDLQQTFDESTAPQITTSLINDSLVLQQGVGIPAPVLEIKDSAGTSQIKLQPTGVIESEGLEVVKTTPGTLGASIQASDGNSTRFQIGNTLGSDTTTEVSSAGTSELLVGGATSLLRLASTGNETFDIANAGANELKISTSTDDLIKISPSETLIEKGFFKVDPLVGTALATVRAQGVDSSQLAIGNSTNTTSGIGISGQSSIVSISNSGLGELSFLNAADQFRLRQGSLPSKLTLLKDITELMTFESATTSVKNQLSCQGVDATQLEIAGQYTLPIVQGGVGQVLTDVLGDGTVSWESPPTGVIPTLQQTFDTSTTPQILTTATNPTMEIRQRLLSASEEPILSLLDDTGSPSYNFTNQSADFDLNLRLRESSIDFTTNADVRRFLITAEVNELQIANASATTVATISQTGEVQADGGLRADSLKGISGVPLLIGADTTTHIELGESTIRTDILGRLEIRDTQQIRLNNTPTLLPNPVVILLPAAAVLLPLSNRICKIVNTAGNGQVSMIQSGDVDSIPVCGVSLNAPSGAGSQVELAIGGTFLISVASGATVNAGDLVEKSDVPGQDGRCVTTQSSPGSTFIALTSNTGNVAGTNTVLCMYKKSESF